MLDPKEYGLTGHHPLPMARQRRWHICGRQFAGGGGPLDRDRELGGREPRNGFALGFNF
jgi:hypothetical protein